MELQLEHEYVFLYRHIYVAGKEILLKYLRLPLNMYDICQNIAFAT